MAGFVLRLVELIAWPVRVRRFAASGYLLVLTWLMLAPARTFGEVGEFLPHQDKIVHGGLFLTLAVLARWAMEPHGRGVRGWQWGFTALVLYAGAIEALQPIIGGPGRQFDWLDMGSNFAGAGVGWLLCGWAGECQARGLRK